MKDKKQKDQLYREDYFSCPIYWMDKPEWVKKLNKASDPYIKKAAKNNKKQITIINIFNHNILFHKLNFKLN